MACMDYYMYVAVWTLMVMALLQAIQQSMDKMCNILAVLSAGPLKRGARPYRPLCDGLVDLCFNPAVDTQTTLRATSV